MSLKTQLQTLSNDSLSLIEYVKKKCAIADSLDDDLNPISTEGLADWSHSQRD